MATPSFAVRETARKLTPLLSPKTIVVSVAKGIEKETSLRLSQVIEEELRGRNIVAALGPHAEEVGRAYTHRRRLRLSRSGRGRVGSGSFMNERS